MGSCFRVGRKKNSYTVTQVDEEYSTSGGSYREKQVTNYPAQGKARGKQTKANPAVQNGNERLPDVASMPEKARSPSTTSTVSVHSEADKVTLTTKSVHAEEVRSVESHPEVSTPMPSNMAPEHNIPAPETNDLVLETNESAPEYNDPASETNDLVPETSSLAHEDQLMSSTYPNPHKEEIGDAIRDHIGGEEQNDVYVSTSVEATEEDTETEAYEATNPIDVRPELSDTDSNRESFEVAQMTQPVLDTPAAVVESQVTFKETPETITYTPQMTVEESYQQEDDSEQFSATPYQHDTLYETSAGELSTAHVLSEEQAMSEVEITDSPAGTWDARLNTEVRAELDEVRRSLSSSRASSTGSLNYNPVPENADPAELTPTEHHTEYHTEHQNNGVTVTTTYSHDEYSSEDMRDHAADIQQDTKYDADHISQPTYTAETQAEHTHHRTEFLDQDDSQFDNIHNEQLAAGGPPELAQGEIVLNDVIYDVPGPIAGLPPPLTDDGF